MRFCVIAQCFHALQCDAAGPGKHQDAAQLRPSAASRGYGNPDDGRRHLVSSTAPEAGPVPDAPDDLHAFAVRYGPRGTFTAAFEREGAGLMVRTEAFAARIGDPAGDAHGEPELTRSAC